MPQITYEALLRGLSDRPARSAFFFHGEEEHLREEAVARTVGAFLDPATRDFNLDQLRGSDASADSLASLLGTPPMMAEWRVVVLRDAQGLSVKARETLEGVIRAAPGGLALVVTAAIPAGSKAKFYATLQSACTSVEFGAVDALDAPGWLMEQAAREHSVEIEPDAARALVGAIGPHLGTLTSELRKLVAFAGERTVLTVEDVRSVAGALPRQDRWAWFDLVAERRFDEALAALPVLLSAGENGVGLTIGITAQLLRVAVVCAGGQGALERELKPFQKWMVRRIVPQARRWTLPEVDRALSELLRTDRLLKSASLSDRQVMEELILRLWAIRPHVAAAQRSA